MSILRWLGSLARFNAAHIGWAASAPTDLQQAPDPMGSGAAVVRADQATGTVIGSGLVTLLYVTDTCAGPVGLVAVTSVGPNDSVP